VVVVGHAQEGGRGREGGKSVNGEFEEENDERDGKGDERGGGG
jgi:hypothetical protein